MSRSKKNKEPQYYISKINTQLLNYNVYYMSKKEKLMYYTIAFVAGGSCRSGQMPDIAAMAVGRKATASVKRMPDKY